MELKYLGLPARRLVQLFWIVPAAFYAVTMAKTIGYVDAALVLSNAYHLQISAWVNNHNLFSILGWLWIRLLPLGSEFLRINLLSALFGAGTVYFIFLTCLSQTERLWVSLIAATALMLSQSLWWHSTMLEVYTLNSFLIALILYCTSRYLRTRRKKWFFAAVLFWGLGVSNHVLMALFVLAFLLLLIMERKRFTASDLAKGAAFLLLGLSIFIFAFVKSYLRYRSVLAVIDLLTGGEFRSLMFADVPKVFWRLNYLFLIAFQYPSLVLIFLFYGIFLLVAKHERFDLFLIAALAPQIVWSANYFVWDMYAFSLPVYVLLAPVIGRGLARMAERRKLLAAVSVSLIIPIFLYSNVERITPIRKIVDRYPMVEMVRHTFDPVKYFLDPNKLRFDSVDRFVMALFDELPRHATYYDDVHDYPIHYYYQQIRGLRPDLRCPVTWTFFIGDRDKARVADDIKARIRTNQPVFVTGFVLETVASLLPAHETREIRIYDQVIYRLY